MKAFFKNIFHGISDFIGKGTKTGDESRTLIIAVRLMLISIISYFALSGIFYIPQRNFLIFLFCVVFLALFSGLFIMSYHCKPKVLFYVFNIEIIAWIYIIIYSFGWNIGVQHFLAVLLILCYFSCYNQYRWKVKYAAFLCTLRIWLFYAYHDKVPACQLEVSQENILQVINTVTIFLCISMIAAVFSNDSQEFENRMVIYALKLQEEAYTDTLTGLYNRRKALEYMDYLTKEQNKGFSLCICDIDLFKKVNDTYGHDFGDEVLKEIAKVFKEETKNKGFAARWGGEEFLLLFPECSGKDAYIRLLNIRDRVKALKIKKEDTVVSVTMTFGLAEHITRNSFEATIKEADKRMYFGKENGRDRIVFND